MKDNPMHYQDFLADDGEWLSLAKLAGKNIVDIRGYLTLEFGRPPTFQMTAIIFEDGSEMGAEGEHDCPYVTTYPSFVPDAFSDEALTQLYREQAERNGDSMEDEEDEEDYDA